MHALSVSDGLAKVLTALGSGSLTTGELRELREGLRGTKGGTQELIPPILENSGGDSGGTSTRWTAVLRARGDIAVGSS